MSESPPKRFIHEGLHYHSFLRDFVIKKKALSYFEIGVNKGKSLRLIDVESIGVDPNFIIDGDVVGKKPALHLFQDTSDSFFEKQDVKGIFPNGIDVAFLDGMHLFEFLLRDFVNIERYMHKDGVVFMHDCLPINAEMAERDRRPGLRVDLTYKSHWTGDVWKLIPILRQTRPDLIVRVLDCAPTGLVVVYGLKPDASPPIEYYKKITKQYANVVMTDDRIDLFYKEAKAESAEKFREEFFGAKP